MTRVFGAMFAMVLCWGCSCGSSPHQPEGVCARDNPPASCGQDCTGATPCPDGFYCAEPGVCTQDCDPLVPEANCPGGRCNEHGVCDAFHRDGGGMVDASFICADVRVQANRVTPTVILIVDQSGSMTSDFGRSNRWDALRDSLLARPDGFIAALESQVRFGLALYSAEFDMGEPVGMCPRVEFIPPAIDNYAAIDAVYGSADPLNETPTGESVDAILTRLSMVPDPTDDPTIFILATDGEPDTCAEPNPQNGQPEAIAAVRRAYEAGVRTFIISVGTDVSTGHLQDVANTGVGNGPGDPDAPFWVAGDDAGLRDALTAIIGGELSCVVTLSGMIQEPDLACTGTVILNGLPIPCDDPDGWHMIDATHIELSGDSCDLLQSTPGATLEATFPCDVVLI
ncbi:MAG: VWA domain-containing protein [Sandaracinaceae bacterium]|nr:VWA domain-containing protein [Sandaracinaceae bacterium]